MLNVLIYSVNDVFLEKITQLMFIVLKNVVLLPR